MAEELLYERKVQHTWLRYIDEPWFKATLLNYHTFPVIVRVYRSDYHAKSKKAKKS